MQFQYDANKFNWILYKEFKESQFSNYRTSNISAISIYKYEKPEMTKTNKIIYLNF